MSDPATIDFSLLVLRGIVGVVFLAHGYNHVWGGGKIAGTARWFDSLGMRPGLVHAWVASVTELGVGALLLAGLLIPLAAAGVVGVMVVALVTNHLRNGFFIFRPGEGYEYVLTLILVAVALGGLGAGSWSLDAALDIDFSGWTGLLVAVICGGGGAAVLLALCWRPARIPVTAP